MNADRYYDTPYGDNTDREQAYDSCIQDAETTTRDVIVAILGATAKHVTTGRGLQLPAQREALSEDAIEAAGTHLEALDELLEHHGFDARIDGPVSEATTVFLTALTDAVHTYNTHLVGAVEEHATAAEWHPDTRPPFFLRRTA